MPVAHDPMPEGIIIGAEYQDADEWEAITGITWVQLSEGFLYRGGWENQKPHGKGCMVTDRDGIGLAQGWMNMGVICGTGEGIKPTGSKCTTPFTDGKKNGEETEQYFNGGTDTRTFDMVDL